MIVGVVHGLVGFTPTLTLLTFFISSTILTRMGGKKKAQLEDGHREGGQRTWQQVVANGGAGVVICLLHLYGFGPYEHCLDFLLRPAQSSLHVALIAAYAAACGDTWSSEVGILSRGQPRLITSCRSVPKGTNGAVSLLGVLFSVLGGVFVALPATLIASFVTDGKWASQWPTLLIGAFAGFLGSFIDSVLGALMQYSGWDDSKKHIIHAPTKSSKHVAGRNWLDNNEVNLVSNLITALIVVATAPFFYRLGSYV